MELHEQEIAAADLQVGMYVCRLDCDWNDTPFPLQGVLIRTREDIEQIAQHARRVWVDLEKSTGPATFHLQSLSPTTRAKSRSGAGDDPEFGAEATSFDQE